MYRVAVRRQFVAQHFRIGGEWGPERARGGRVRPEELELAGAALDRHNFLVDIVEIEKQLDAACAYYRDQTLNTLPEFENTNPSVELFAQRLAERLNAMIPAQNIRNLTVRVWENDIAWAAYELER